MANSKKTTAEENLEQSVEREYFVPEHGVTVQAKSIEDAVKKVEATLKKRVGDGK
jgi:ribulose-5-phosphate 4-epimerase/fuculose-1-phosphate aldolase